MAFDGTHSMTDQDLIDWEARIRHAAHGVERRLKGLNILLETFAEELAEARGIPKEQRSGGTGEGKEEEGGG